MFSRFVAPLQFGRHESQQRLGRFGQVVGCGGIAYFIAVQKHSADAFQFAGRHTRPSPKQLLDRTLPGEGTTRTMKVGVCGSDRYHG